MSRFAKLNENWLLRGWTDMPYAVVDWITGDHRRLTQRGFYVAESCDGNSDFCSIAFLPVHNALLDKLIAEGIAKECEKGDFIEPIQQFRKADNPRLGGLHWSITGYCNLNCRHCYMESPSGRYGELSFEDVLRIIEQFEQANVHQVSLTGGEPFLRKDLLDILTVMARAKIGISEIYTNGLLVTDIALDAIRKSGFRPTFQVSFDGCGGHEIMRGCKGIEPGVIAGIAKIRAHGFPLVIATCIDQLNKDCMEATYDLLEKWEIYSWRIAPPQETGNWKGTNTQLSFEEQAQVYELLLKRWLAGGKPFAIQLGGYFRHGGKHDSDPDEKAQFSPDSYDCGSCREKPYLLPDGVLLPCPGYTDTTPTLLDKMPNILKEGLSNGWRNSILRSIANIQKRDLLAQNAECKGCNLLEECGMGCRASAILKTGNLLAKDPVTCEMMKMGHIKRFQKMATSLCQDTP